MKRWGYRLAVLAGILLILCRVGWAESEQISVTRVERPQAGGLRVFFDAVDAEGRPLEDLSAQRLSLTYMGETAVATSVARLSEDDPSAYVFLVDSGFDLDASDAQGLRAALADWSKGMRAGDACALMTFEDKSTIRRDFSDAPLKNALDGVLFGDAPSHLYDALNAANLVARYEETLPARKILILLGEGKDEGSQKDLAYLESTLPDSGVVLYAVVWDPACAPTLEGLVQATGGALLEAALGGDGIKERVALLRDRIENSYVAVFPIGENGGAQDSPRLTLMDEEARAVASCEAAAPAASLAAAETGDTGGASWFDGIRRAALAVSALAGPALQQALGVMKRMDMTVMLIAGAAVMVLIIAILVAIVLKRRRTAPRRAPQRPSDDEEEYVFDPYPMEQTQGEDGLYDFSEPDYAGAGETRDSGTIFTPPTYTQGRSGAHSERDARAAREDGYEKTYVKVERPPRAEAMDEKTRVAGTRVVCLVTFRIQGPEGALVQETKTVGNSFVIGRDPESDLRLSDKAVSLRHGALCFDGVSLTLKDLGSTNGILFNGEKMPGVRIVKSGDTFIFGDTYVRMDVTVKPH